MNALTVRYFAILREQAARESECVESAADTPASLFDELKARHGFTVAQSSLKVVVNEDFVDWSHPLKAGDEVVFIPPVAGG